jgi:hypothetical protein
VGGIARKLGAPKANGSQRLTVMRMMRILKTRRDDMNVYYRIANTKIVYACGLMQVALAPLMKGAPVGQSKKM